jgi:hypothetical protein
MLLPIMGLGGRSACSSPTAFPHKATTMPTAVVALLGKTSGGEPAPADAPMRSLDEVVIEEADAAVLQEVAPAPAAQASKTAYMEPPSVPSQYNMVLSRCSNTCMQDPALFLWSCIYCVCMSMQFYHSCLHSCLCGSPLKFQRERTRHMRANLAGAHDTYQVNRGYFVRDFVLQTCDVQRANTSISTRCTNKQTNIHTLTNTQIHANVQLASSLWFLPPHPTRHTLQSLTLRRPRCLQLLQQTTKLRLMKSTQALRDKASARGRGLLVRGCAYTCLSMR